VSGCGLRLLEQRLYFYFLVLAAVEVTQQSASVDQPNHRRAGNAVLLGQAIRSARGIKILRPINLFLVNTALESVKTPCSVSLQPLSMAL
jgi:hypothetical protein